MLVSQLQQLLIQRTLQPMDTAGMDTTTVVTSNADLEEPIYTAFLIVYPIENTPYPVTDTELAYIVKPSDIIKLVDIAYVYLLRNVVVRLTAVDERLGPHGVWASQYPERIRKMYESALSNANMKYGLDLSTIQAGTVSFQLNGDV